MEPQLLPAPALFLEFRLQIRWLILKLFLRDSQLFQALVRIFPGQGIKHRCHRDHQQHSADPHQLTANRHRHQHPHTGQADGGTHHPGVDQVVFNLLQNQEHDDKPHRLEGIAHQDEERAENAAHKGADQRHQRRHRHQNADQGHIGHPEDQHGHGKQAPQNHGLQALAGDEIGERGVGQP